MGISLRAMAPRMGLSVASLFGYRNGSLPITNKAWSKLERLEREVFGEPGHAKPATYHGLPKYSPIPILEESSNSLRDDVGVYRVKSQQEPKDAVAAKVEMLERSIVGMESQIEMLKQMLQELKNAL